MSRARGRARGIKEEEIDRRILEEGRLERMKRYGLSRHKRSAQEYADILAWRRAGMTYTDIGYKLGLTGHLARIMCFRARAAEMAGLLPSNG